MAGVQSCDWGGENSIFATCNSPVPGINVPTGEAGNYRTVSDRFIIRQARIPSPGSTWWYGFCVSVPSQTRFALPSHLASLDHHEFTESRCYR